MNKKASCMLIGFDNLNEIKVERNKISDNFRIHWVGQGTNFDICFPEFLPDIQDSSWIKNTFKINQSYFSSYAEKINSTVELLLKSYLRRFKNHNFIPYDNQWNDLLYAISIFSIDKLKEIQPKFILFNNIPHQLYDEIFMHYAIMLNIPCFARYQLPVNKHSLLIKISLDQANKLKYFNNLIESNHIVDNTWLSENLFNLWYMQPTPKNSFDAKKLFKIFNFHKYNEYKDRIGRKFVKLAIKNFYDLNFTYKNLKKNYSASEHNRFKIVIFMHVQPEMSTNILGREWESPVSIILDIISLFKKYNPIIYIKEHPNQKSGYRSKILENIRCFYDDIFLYESNNKIENTLLNSDLIVTNTGTVIYQSLLLGTPVLAYGQTLINNNLLGYFNRSLVTSESFDKIHLINKQDIIKSFKSYEILLKKYCFAFNTDPTINEPTSLFLKNLTYSLKMIDEQI